MPAATSRPGGRPGRVFTLLSPFTPLAVAPGAQVSGRWAGRLVLGLPYCNLVPAEGRGSGQGASDPRSWGTWGSTRPGEPLRCGHVRLPVPLRAKATLRHVQTCPRPGARLTGTGEAPSTFHLNTFWFLLVM